MKRKLMLWMVVMILCLSGQRLMAESRVYITSKPSDTAVKWDGESIGNTPLLGLVVKIGTYQLEFQKKGYQTKSHTLKVTADGLDYPVHVTLTPVPPSVPRTGSLRVESQPSGATVYLDSVRQSATTPIIIKGVPAGNHTVQVQKSGYKSVIRTASVAAGKTKIVSVSLSPSTPSTPPIGTITVRTQPSGATVKLDGKYIGSTPIVRKEMQPGNYRILITKSGFNNVSRSLSIKAGVESPLSFSLNRTRIVRPPEPTPPVEPKKATPPGEPKKATLVAKSQPTNATVYLDGNLVGHTPLSKSVDAGSHTIRIVAAVTGYKEWNATRSFAPGETVNVNPTLIYISTIDTGGGGGGRRKRDFNFIPLIIGVVVAGAIAVAVALVVLLIRRPPPPDPTPVPDPIPHGKSGEIFGEYKLLGEIGSGGMAVVYRARHQRHSRVIALKMPHENMIKEGEFVNRFLRQGEIGRQLRHPRIVRVIESGEVGGMPYLAMEYIQGGDLRQLLKQRGQLSISQAVNYAVQVCEALDYVHLRHIYHRDIKPENILLEDGAHVKVMDFGIALAKQMPSLSVDGIRWLSGGYMCPDSEVGSTSDLYSLGTVLYEMLTGRLPFQSGDLMELIRMHERAPVPPLRGLRPEIPAGLEAVVMKMMAKTPEGRYQQAVDVIRALEQYLT